MKTATFARRLSTTMVSLSLLGLASLPAATFAAPPATGEVSKGTEQMKGASGVFGVVYTMQAGENLQLIGAKYTLEGHKDYGENMPMPDQKIFWLTFAEKNPRSEGDIALGEGINFTLVDEDGNNYETGSGQLKLTKQGFDGPHLNMKPGQGVGQDPLTNELSMAWAIPRQRQDRQDHRQRRARGRAE